MYVFPKQKPNMKEYYLNKMTSMYSKNFRIAVLLSIAYKIACEILYFIAFRSYDRYRIIRIIKMFMLLPYCLIANMKSIIFSIRIVKIFLIITVISELLMNAAEIHYFTYVIRAQFSIENHILMYSCVILESAIWSCS